MKTLLALAPIPFLLSACMVNYDYEVGAGTNGNAGYARGGSGVAVTETRPLSSFSRVQIEVPMHVTVKTGSDYAAYVTLDDNLAGELQTSTFAGTLTISLASAIQPTVVPEITVVVPDIHAVVNNSDGLTEIQENGNFPDLDLELNGAGEIRFSGTASHLTTDLNGSGRIALEGYADLLTANLRGDGEIRGGNLLTEGADVNLSGTGNLYLDMDYQSELNLSLSGAGNVEWWGSPSSLNYSLTGVGKVIEHKGLPKRAASAAKKTAQGREYQPTTPEPARK